VALLRAVNVEGTGKLPMATLTQLCQASGFDQVKTYVASGNVVFRSDADEDQVRSAIESRLEAYAGKPVGVLVRTGGEIADVLARNPFADHPGNRTVALFVDEPLPPDALDKAVGVQGEQLCLGQRVIFIAYGEGMGTSRLRVPAAMAGTARNMNTVAKLAEMAAAIS